MPTTRAVASAPPATPTLRLARTPLSRAGAASR